MPTGLRSPRRTLLRACKRSARVWASSSATAPAARPCQIERERWSNRVSVRAPSIAAAIWSQKDMRSPSGGEARRRDVTQVGKTPPSPEMTLSGLTEGGLSGKIMSPDIDFPRLCRTLRPAPQAGCFVSRLRLSKDSAQITSRHRAFRTAAVVSSSVSAKWPPRTPLCGSCVPTVAVPAHLFQQGVERGHLRRCRFMRCHALLGCRRALLGHLLPQARPLCIYRRKPGLKLCDPVSQFCD